MSDRRGGCFQPLARGVSKLRESRSLTQCRNDSALLGDSTAEATESQITPIVPRELRSSSTAAIMIEKGGLGVEGNPKVLFLVCG